MSDPLKALLHYEIYNYLQPGKRYNRYEAPWSIDFKTGLSTSLHAVREFTLGTREKTTWYAVRNVNGTYSVPVVETDYNWTFDATGLAVSVQATVSWYLVDGTIGPYPKVLQPEFYTPEERVAEANRRRINQINSAGKTAIGALMAVESMSEVDAYTNGTAYWRELSNEIVQYKEGNTALLKDRLNTDTTPTWVTNIKQYVLAELV